MQLVILAASIMVPGPQNTVGLALGTNDGVTVGLALGTNDGVRDGLAVLGVAGGTNDGATVGLALLGLGLEKLNLL